VPSDKEGSDSHFEHDLPIADGVVSQPFWPAYLTAGRIAKAPNLKLSVTAGINSDHVDLPRSRTTSRSLRSRSRTASAPPSTV
jgi:formate dehydrogenase